MLPLFNDAADYLLYWHTQKKRLISRKMNSYEGWQEKYVFALIIATCQQLLKLHFPSQNVGILIQIGTELIAALEVKFKLSSYELSRELLQKMSFMLSRFWLLGVQLNLLKREI